jgi:hypothetical protein
MTKRATLSESIDLGVGLTEHRVSTFAKDLSVTNNDATNARIWPCPTKAERRQTQRTTHPFYIAGVRHMHTSAAGA